MLENVLIAFAVVTAIGLSAGILLALAYRFLHVKGSEEVEKIMECLPQVNCGVCGYAGCEDYAKAIVAGKAKTNLCAPGSDAVAAKIAALLGVEAEDVVELIAHVRCNGNCSATRKIAEYDGVRTCRAQSMVFGGPNTCRFGCLGCGDCARNCPNNAIFVCDGIAHVDGDLCIGCGLCVRGCSKGVIEIVPKVNRVGVMCSSRDKGAIARKACTNACIGCKKCETNCPEKAITVKNNLAVLDQSKCTGCGACVDGCPTHCIHILPELTKE